MNSFCHGNMFFFFPLESTIVLPFGKVMHYSYIFDLLLGIEVWTLRAKHPFETKMSALLSLFETSEIQQNRHNVFEIFLCSEAQSSTVWWDTAWLLEWSQQSTNQYDCSCLLLQRHTRACVQRDCCSSAKNVLQRYSDMVLENKCPVINISAEILWVKGRPVWLIIVAE